jgi:hypothetical protein
MHSTAETRPNHEPDGERDRDNRDRWQHEDSDDVPFERARAASGRNARSVRGV